MKVDYAEEGSALRHLDIELPAEKLNDEFEKGVVKLRKSVKLPGFRKGKIPKDVIRSRFHSDVLEQAVHDLLNKAVRDALKARELYPLGDPQISNPRAQARRATSFPGHRSKSCPTSTPRIMKASR